MSIGCSISRSPYIQLEMLIKLLKSGMGMRMGMQWVYIIKNKMFPMGMQWVCKLSIFFFRVLMYNT